MAVDKLTPEKLREIVIAELETIGFYWEGDKLRLPNKETKAFYRKLHLPAKQAELRQRQAWLRRKLPQYLSFFADGDEVDPSRIEPVLIQVEKDWHYELFRIARLTWSLPYSKGFGRRLAYLIMDRSNDRLIGILRLQSPPLSFPARDRLFSYPAGRKTELVNQTMDIETLGAIPPYSRLLGAKLVAMAATSNEVRETYQQKYGGRETIMEGRVLPAELVAFTTTSAFGRSSIYNRLRYDHQPIACSIGYTEGYGSFHLLRLYPLFRDFLESEGISTRGGYGTGPRIKWQTMVRALSRLGFPSDVLKHGVQREAYLFPLASNLKDYMEGRAKKPKYPDRPFTDLADSWRGRWLIKRAERVNGWQDWKRDHIARSLLMPAAEQLEGTENA